MTHFLKDALRPFYRKYRRWREERLFRQLLAGQKEGPLRVVIGSSRIFQKGWLPSEAHFLDLLEPATWLRFFKENEIDNLLAEHVWEHLTAEQGRTAARTCHRFLKKGGSLRVAVPDGFHPDAGYIERVRPGGTGAGADDHKVLYNHLSFSKTFEENGFRVELLEYFDEKGQFHATDWRDKEGHVHRSIRFDRRNADGRPNYTSLILDAVKI